MKITIWLATRERASYVAAAEIAALALVLIYAPGAVVRLLIGLPLLAHLGYTALTALPMGTIPGRPAGARQRRNQELRSQVAAFLREVRRVEDYVQRAKVAGHPREEIEQSLQIAERRMMAAATEVVKATGRSIPGAEDVPREGASASRKLQVFAPAGQQAAGS